MYQKNYKTMMVNMTTATAQNTMLNGGNLYAAPLSDKTKKMPTVDTSGRFKTKNKKHDTKLIKKWHIQDFAITSLYIQISWHQLPVGQCRTLNVSRRVYERWLYATGRLNCYVVGPHGIKKATGKMHVADYWEHEYKEVHMEDLDEYVTHMQLLA